VNGPRIALLEVIMSNQDATQPIARSSTRSRFAWIARSAAVVLATSLLTSCFIETGRYHHPRHHVIFVR